MRSQLAVPWMLWFLLISLFAALPPSALALTANQVYEQVKDSVVVVKAYDQQGKPVGLGSGVRLPSGDVITNFHVVKAGVRYMVGQGKQGLPATLKSGDPDKDLCLLTAPGLTAKPARLGRTARLKVGHPVYAVGAPQGLELSLSEGIVSQLRGGPPPLIQTTVAISQGSSGGGLFNAEAELVGITTFYLKDSQSLNFALPVEWIGELVAKGKKPIWFEPLSEVDWLNQTKVLENAKDWQGLLSWCRQWTQAQPGNASAWFYLGRVYEDLGRYGEAIEAYRESLRLKSDYAEAWCNLGVAYGKMERYQESAEACEKALRLNPRDAKAEGALGMAYGKMGKLGRNSHKVDFCQEVVRRNPNSADAWYSLAVAYGESGNRLGALEALKELRRLDPQMADKLLIWIVRP
jgi:Tfp pilus assembly protein PilF